MIKCEKNEESSEVIVSVEGTHEDILMELSAIVTAIEYKLGRESIEFIFENYNPNDNEIEVMFDEET